MRQSILLVLLLSSQAFVSTVNGNEDRVQKLEELVSHLGRQMMLQEFANEESNRYSGDSGIKQTRTNFGGNRPYMSPSHTGKSAGSIHDHANNVRTVGMGQFAAVLNGVEFRTRHNDYALKMPSTSSGKYQEMEDIPYPEVPPAVKNMVKIDDQIKEMREWFRAWRDQDTSVRDYRPYFKPVLCYMEGFWTHSTGKIDEPFASDRHFIDASTWFELQQKVRFASASGRKDPAENQAYLPTTVLEFHNGTTPAFGQWNYRIACHPLKNDLPLNRLHVANELNARMLSRKSIDEHKMTRAARFELNPKNENKLYTRVVRKTFLDSLMNEVPGMDNYGCNQTDIDISGSVALDYDTDETLNSCYYHRWFRNANKDANGESINRRGFSDSSIYMAMTSQEKIADVKMEKCLRKTKNQDCQEKSILRQKWTYAIPLEVVYLTPLYNWNPYNIEFKGWANSPSGRTVYANGRNGLYNENAINPNKAYNGTNTKMFFQTPSEFFSGGDVDKSKADTSGGLKTVLDKSGTVRVTRASGTRIFLPDIEGVGKLRTRYPIFPVTAHGESVWKELAALKDIVLRSQTYANMFTEPIQGVPGVPGATAAPPKDTILETKASRSNRVTSHTHIVELTPEEYRQLVALGEMIEKQTSTNDGHSHKIGIVYLKKENRFWMKYCDRTTTPKCWDKHPRDFVVVS